MALNTGDKLSQLLEQGFCVLPQHLPVSSVEACCTAFWPILLEHLKTQEPNRGAGRYFLPMPFDRPCFSPEFFFDPEVLKIVYGAMDQRVVADQWGCDTPIRGSEHQTIHADYQRPLFPEWPDLLLPPYMLVVSFGLIEITQAHGPIEIAPGTHKMPREEARRAIEAEKILMQPVPLQLGDVLIRHPWALHRGTPNMTDIPRALTTIRYVRSWYTDNSREVSVIAPSVWQSLTPEQQRMMRFPRLEMAN